MRTHRFTLALGVASCVLLAGYVAAYCLTVSRVHWPTIYYMAPHEAHVRYPFFDSPIEGERPIVRILFAPIHRIDVAVRRQYWIVQ